MSLFARDAGGDIRPVIVDTDGHLQVDVVTGPGNTQYDAGGAAADDATGTVAIFKRQDARGSITGQDDGDYAVALLDADNALWITGAQVQGNAHASADKGMGTLVVRKDAPANLAGTVEDDYTFLECDAKGCLWIAGSQIEDVAHTTGDRGMGALSVRRDDLGATGLAGSDGDYAFLITDSLGRLWTTGTQVEDAAHSTGDQGMGILAVRDDTPQARSSAAGDYTFSSCDKYGALYVHPIVSSRIFAANAATPNPAEVEYSLRATLSGTTSADSWAFISGAGSAATPPGWTAAAYSTGDAYRLESSSTSDAAGQSGLITVKVGCINASGVYDVRPLTLDGIARVNIGATNIHRVLWVNATSAGSNKAAVGDISIVDDEFTPNTIFSPIIPAGESASNWAYFSVPRESYGYITRLIVTSSEVIDIRIMENLLADASTAADVTVNKYEASGQAHYDIKFDEALRFEELSDVYMEARSSVANPTIKVFMNVRFAKIINLEDDP